MSAWQLETDDPPGQVVWIPTNKPRDSQGRTLDQALFEDQAARAEEWERKLRRAHRPLAVLDTLALLVALPTLLVGVMCTITSFATGDPGWSDQAIGWMLAGVGTFIGYTVLTYTVLRPWIRRRLDRVIAVAQQKGMTLDRGRPDAHRVDAGALIAPGRPPASVSAARTQR